MEEIKNALVMFGGGQVNGKSGNNPTLEELKGSTNDYMYLLRSRVVVEYRNGNRYLKYGDTLGDNLVVNVSTRAGRMAARAYALTYLAEEPNELRGEEVYNEIIKLIGESE